MVIFVKSVQRAKALNALLNECNFPSVCIHRGMDQKERINVYSQFKENKVCGAWVFVVWRPEAPCCCRLSASSHGLQRFAKRAELAASLQLGSSRLCLLTHCTSSYNPCCLQVRILVATDLVGRGIDVERVNIVINYDMPVTDETHGNGAGAWRGPLTLADCCRLLVALCAI